MTDHKQDNFSEENDFNINVDENISGTEGLDGPIDENGDTSTRQEGAVSADKWEKELAESKDKYMRLAAEFDNYRKRTAKERVELFQTAGKEIITSLLDVLDDMDRAAPQLETLDDDKAKEGVFLIFNKLKNILQSKGLKPMEAIGQEFNPDLHEAITEIPAPADEQKGKIVDEITKGYYLNDKIIRHAKVVVGK